MIYTSACQECGKELTTVHFFDKTVPAAPIEQWLGDQCTQTALWDAITGHVKVFICADDSANADNHNCMRIDVI